MREVRNVGIIEAAKLADRHINNNRELLEKQLDMLKTIYEHKAISEAEYRRSINALQAAFPRASGKYLNRFHAIVSTKPVFNIVLKVGPYFLQFTASTYL